MSAAVPIPQIVTVLRNLEWRLGEIEQEANAIKVDLSVMRRELQAALEAQPDGETAA